MLGLRIGIDFGSTNLTLFVDGKGIVINEPSVMVCDAYTGKTLAIGNSAKKMLGKLPESMKVVYPIKDGIVSDYDAACLMLRAYINKLCSYRLFRPNVLMCVPSTVTTLERKTIFDAVMASGAGRACFVDEPLAAAIGAGVSLTRPQGSFVCDIGGGTTDCAVVTMGNIAAAKSAKVGGNDFTRAITDYILREYGILVGKQEAEEIKRCVGAAVLRNEEVAFISCGKNADTGMPVYFEVTSTEIYWILKGHIEAVSDCVKKVLEITPPELCADISDNGIILTGGSANLFGMDKFIEWSTGIKTHKAKNAEECAAAGIGRLLKNMKYLEKNGYIFRPADEENEES